MNNMHYMVEKINSLRNSMIEKQTHIPSEDISMKLSDRRSWKDDEGYWHVYPIYVNRYQVTIACPLCGEIHLHGNPQDGDYSGHRVGHCDDPDNNGYFIEKIEDLTYMPE